MVDKQTVAARMISPIVPSDSAKREELLEDLRQIGWVGLLERLWNLRNDDLIQELILGVPNQYELTVRGQPGAWTNDI